MSAPATAEQVAALREDVAELTRLVSLVLPLAVRQKSRGEQARKAGVSVRTLQRRERKLSARLYLT